MKVTAINDYSVVVGSVSYDDAFTLGGEAMHGAYWQSKLTQQPTVVGFVSGEATAAGDTLGSGGFKAALYRGGGITSLGTIENTPGFQSSALAINDYSEIVGWSEFSSPDHGIIRHAFVSTGVGMSDLNALISPRNSRITLTEAHAINCQGWIVAIGYENATLIPHGYLLKPQPQPLPQRPECQQKMAFPDRAPIIPDIWS